MTENDDASLSVEDVGQLVANLWANGPTCAPTKLFNV